MLHWTIARQKWSIFAHRTDCCDSSSPLSWLLNLILSTGFFVIFMKLNLFLIKFNFGVPVDFHYIWSDNLIFFFSELVHYIIESFIIFRTGNIIVEKAPNTDVVLGWCAVFIRILERSDFIVSYFVNKLIDKAKIWNGNPSSKILRNSSLLIWHWRWIF